MAVGRSRAKAAAVMVPRRKRRSGRGPSPLAGRRGYESGTGRGEEEEGVGYEVAPAEGQELVQYQGGDQVEEAGREQAGDVAFECRRG
ncbi:hypothetical protein VTK26DRAFT_3604 [Humicola hyalothermophila]